MGEKGLKKSGDVIFGQPLKSFLLHQSFTFGSHLLAQCTIVLNFLF